MDGIIQFIRFCIATHLDFFLESFLKIKDDGETGNGGLNGRGVLRPWTCSWSKGDSSGDSWKNDDEEPSAAGEYAGVLFGECSWVVWYSDAVSFFCSENFSPSIGRLELPSSGSDITDLLRLLIQLIYHLMKEYNKCT